MKKFISKISAVAVVSLVTLSSSYAKTEGSYVGLSIHKVAVEHINQDRTGASGFTDKYGNNKVNLGLDYKYAINVADKIFIAPGAFYERIGTKSTDRGGFGNVNTVRFNNRFGAKLDIGYDVNDNTAVYFTNGLSHMNYKINIQNAGAGDAVVTNEGLTAYFWGFGLMSHVNENVTLGVEYNAQDFKTSLLGTQAGMRIKNDIDLYKINVAYHF